MSIVKAEVVLHNRSDGHDKVYVGQLQQDEHAENFWQAVCYWGKRSQFENGGVGRLSSKVYAEGPRERVREVLLTQLKTKVDRGYGAYHPLHRLRVAVSGYLSISMLRAWMDESESAHRHTSLDMVYQSQTMAELDNNFQDTKKRLAETPKLHVRKRALEL